MVDEKKFESMDGRIGATGKLDPVDEQIIEDISTGQNLIKLDPEMFEAMARKAKSVYDEALELFKDMDEVQAFFVADLRVNKSYSWMAIAHACHEHGGFGKWEPPSNQIYGMALCETAAKSVRRGLHEGAVELSGEVCAGEKFWTLSCRGCKHMRREDGELRCYWNYPFKRLVKVDNKRHCGYKDRYSQRQSRAAWLARRERIEKELSSRSGFKIVLSPFAIMGDGYRNCGYCDAEITAGYTAEGHFEERNIHHHLCDDCAVHFRAAVESELPA